MGNDVGGPIAARRDLQTAPWVGSPRLCYIGGVPPIVSTAGTDSTPVVTETYIGELQVAMACLATGLALMNGSAVAGKVVGILYNRLGAVVAYSALAGVDQAGTDAWQRIPFTTPAKLKAGLYYAGFQFNNTSARFNAQVFGNFGASKKTGEVFGTPTAITPPTTFTTNLAALGGLY